jgi:hypothetical protein
MERDARGLFAVAAKLVRGAECRRCRLRPVAAGSEEVGRGGPECRPGASPCEPLDVIDRHCGFELAGRGESFLCDVSDLSSLTRASVAFLEVEASLGSRGRRRSARLSL